MQRPVLTNIQILRFLAAVSILVKHCLFLVMPASRLLTLPWAAGVDVFFVISGFIMAWLTRGRFGTPNASGRFLLRRAIRIVPPYWFFTTLMVIGLLVAPQLARNTSLGWSQVITSYGFIPAQRPINGSFGPLLSVGWTLNYEVFFYICFSAALWFRRGVLWLCAGFVALALAHPFIPPEPFVPHFYSDPIILEFLAGIMLERIYRSGVRLPWWGSQGLVLGGAAAFALTLSMPLLDDYRFAKFGIPAAIIAAAFILGREPQRIGRVRKALSAAGDASYTLYLCHPFTAEAALLTLGTLGLGLGWPTLIVPLVLSIATAMLFFRYIERPVTKALQTFLGFSREREAQMVAP